MITPSMLGQVAYLFTRQAPKGLSLVPRPSMHRRNVPCSPQSPPQELRMIQYSWQWPRTRSFGDTLPKPIRVMPWLTSRFLELHFKKSSVSTPFLYFASIPDAYIAIAMGCLVTSRLRTRFTFLSTSIIPRLGGWKCTLALLYMQSPCLLK